MADGAASYPGGLGRHEMGADIIPVLPPAIRRISWGAVFAGLIVSVMVSLVLATLGMSIGLGAVNPMEEANPFAGLGMGAALWWVISSLIALFCGGWVAARMAGIPKRFDGALHGVLAWGLVTLLTFYFLGTAIGRLVGGVSSMVGQGMSAVGKGVSGMAPQAAETVKQELQRQGIEVDRIKQEGEQMLRQAVQPLTQPGPQGQPGQPAQAGRTGQAAQGGAAMAATDPSQAAGQLKDIIQRMKDGAATQADKDAAANIIASRTGKSPQESRATVDKWSVTLQQSAQKMEKVKAEAEAKAREWGQAAASGMSKASMWTFIALILGGLASALGGRLGIPKEAVIRQRN
jgi:hypothetical protein